MKREIKDLVKKDQDYICAFCQIKETKYLTLQIHHIVPRSKGGADTIDNLVALCPNCHCTIHSIMGQATT
jgi:5-methylcytosine-specific restriction protein A